MRQKIGDPSLNGTGFVDSKITNGKQVWHLYGEKGGRWIKRPWNKGDMKIMNEKISKWINRHVRVN